MLSVYETDFAVPGLHIDFSKSQKSSNLKGIFNYRTERQP